MARSDPRPSRNVGSWVSSIVALSRWLKLSRTGDRFTYAHGELLLDPTLGEHVRNLAATGEVKMRRDRASDGLFDYYVIRDRVRTVTEARQPKPPALDANSNALLLKLGAVARAGERCPSDKVLGASIGLLRSQVSWGFRKLRELEIIKTEVIATADDPKYRIVTILTGKLAGCSTARPGAGR